MMPSLRNFGSYLSLSDFDVLREIGRGASGRVFEAEDRRNHRRVALKCIDHDALKRDPSLLVRTNTEAEIHSELKHPSILEMYDCFQDKGNAYFVLELCSQDLSHLIKSRRRISEDDAKPLFREIVKGLIYLHDKKIIHRDLKPGNILLSPDNHVKIADFGLATRTDEDAAEHNTICGTPNYMAPEIHSRNHTSAADHWSLGVLLYTMLVGKPPFEVGDNYMASYRPFVCPPGISAAARDLINCLLQPEPSKRMILERVLLHPWLEVSGGSPLGKSFDSGQFSFESSNSSGSFQSRLGLSNGKGERKLGTIEEFSHSDYEASRHSSSTDRRHISLPERTGASNPNQMRQISLPDTGNRPTGNLPIADLKPFDTKFLKPCRVEVKKKMVWSILESGEVTVELIKDGTQGWYETVRISSDGRLVCVYYPTNGIATPLKSYPAPKPTNATTYEFSNLPAQYRKKYQYASFFVDMVKSKTVKHWIATDCARSRLMRNEPIANVETEFYDGVRNLGLSNVKIIESSKDVTAKYSHNGLERKDTYQPTDSLLRERLGFYWNHHVLCKDRLILQDQQATLAEEKFSRRLMVYAFGFGRKPEAAEHHLPVSGSPTVNLTTQSLPMFSHLVNSRSPPSQTRSEPVGRSTSLVPPTTELHANSTCSTDPLHIVHHDNNGLFVFSDGMKVHMDESVVTFSTHNGRESKTFEKTRVPGEYQTKYIAHIYKFCKEHCEK